MLVRRRTLGAGLLFCACGGSAGSPDDSPRGGIGGSSVAGAPPVGGTGAAAGAASPAGAGGSAAAGAPSSLGQCAGPPSSFTAVLMAAAGLQLASPAIAPDNLELFYVEYTSQEAPRGNFRRATRTSVTTAFSAGQIVPELDQACPEQSYRSIDLSADGLRAYLQCFPSYEESVGELRVARRSSPSAPFALDETSYGRVGASPSISADELSTYTSFEMGIAAGPPRVYTRTSLDAPFSSGATVAGLEGTLLSTPEIAADGLALWANMDGGIGLATRANVNASFGAPSLVIPREMDVVLGAPDLSADCRRLYYIRVQADQRYVIMQASMSG